ncbi:MULTISPECIES: YueI family protein [Bacillus]|uniref:YueI family protein n=1 Tax=Bacillus bingmayongensis TaxID=1150157 RepID=A0ABU5K3P6_9BACI|nr:MULTISPECIES: YueI family protein [Bacillus]MBO1580031.1 YueI family protein [Bacillus sp. XF8]MDZ5610364.1 YueI family protein [Bacillus pseudomycoides]
MANKNVEDYLQEGIHGQKQNKPEERNMYLSTLRERVEIALTIGQVMQSNVYTEVANSMRTSQSLQLYVNGSITYPHLSKYIKLANEKNVPFTIVQNKGTHTPIGLVLAHSTAVDKEQIYVEDAIFKQEMK